MLDVCLPQGPGWRPWWMWRPPVQPPGRRGCRARPCALSFDRRTGRVVEIVEKYSGLRDPGRPIPPDATAQHGSLDDVRGHRLDREHVLGLLGRAEFVIAHNERFDRGFVVRLFPEAGMIPWKCS